MFSVLSSPDPPILKKIAVRSSPDPTKIGFSLDPVRSSPDPCSSLAATISVEMARSKVFQARTAHSLQHSAH